MIRLRVTKERKLIFCVGGLLLLLGIVYRLLPVVGEMDSGGEALDLKIQKMAKYQGAILEKESLQKRHLALTQSHERLKERMLKGQTPALAAVSIQNRLNEIAGDVGFSSKSVQVLGAVTIQKTGLVSVGLQFSADLTIRQLKDLLYKIETSNNFLMVKSLQIRQPSDVIPVKLQTTVTIEGIMLSPESKG